MRKLLHFILLAFIACAPEQKATETNASEADTTQALTNQTISAEFMDYLDRLPKLNLPYETDCDNCCTREEIDYDDPLISKFRPEGGSIVGLISRTDKQAMILVTYAADLLVPSVKVYNLEGKLTGEKNFMTNYCGGEPGFYSKQFFTINRNMVMTEIDSVYETTYDSTTYNTLDTTDIKITRSQFKVNAEGEIVEHGDQ